MDFPTADRYTFMDRVGGIYAVGTVKLLLLFQEVMPDDLEQRVGGVELGNAGKSAP